MSAHAILNQEQVLDNLKYHISDPGFFSFHGTDSFFDSTDLRQGRSNCGTHTKKTWSLLQE